LEILKWHDRFARQANWTAQIRQYCYDRVDLSNSPSVLEVGSGTGSLLNELLSYPCIQGTRRVTAIDINEQYLRFSRDGNPKGLYALADAAGLPFVAHNFDLAICHFVLLWVEEPVSAIAEMARVVKHGGAVICLAEPDYGGRIDFPPNLSHLGHLQSEALISQGADPLIGRKLGKILHQAGLETIEIGVLGGQWTAPPSKASWEDEWWVINQDLKHLIDDITIQDFKEQDASAWKSGERILYVPTFYAWGKVL
jgi:ubiquinone/menaquinone biosynthesis C-methylase UbiE